MPTTPPGEGLDPQRFPRAAGYLAALPAGLGGHPQCLARVTIAESHHRDHATIAREARLPPSVGALFEGTVDPDAWIPEVVFQAANLMVRDTRFDSDEAFFEWTYETSRELFDKPVLRTLMRLMSPTLIVLGSTKRWGAFHKGSMLTAGAITNRGPLASVESVLAFPAGLFPSLFLRGLERAFAAALVGARAKDPAVRLVDESHTGARYEVTWR